LHLHLREPFQHLLHEDGGGLGKALTESRGADADLPALQELGEAFYALIGSLEPSQDQCLRKIGSADHSLSFNKSGLFRQTHGFLFQDPL
jgi:hypothetical protein